MILIGVSGGIATGKSTVAEYLKELGCFVIDADLIALQVVEPFKPAWNNIVKHFGKDVVQENGQLDRQKLGDIIFADGNKRRLLNSITHPAILRQMIRDMMYAALTGKRIVVLDLPLLFERNYHKSLLLHKTIVVSCDREQEIERLMKRNNLTESKAIERINSQMPLEEKCRLADIIIDNSKNKSETKDQVIKLFQNLNNPFVIWRNRLLLFTAIVLCVVLVLYLFHFILSAVIL